MPHNYTPEFKKKIIRLRLRGGEKEEQSTASPQSMESPKKVSAAGAMNSRKSFIANVTDRQITSGLAIRTLTKALESQPQIKEELTLHSDQAELISWFAPLYCLSSVTAFWMLCRLVDVWIRFPAPS